MREKYAAEAEAAVGAEEFADAIRPMLSELKDVHVWIELPNGIRRATYRSSFKPNDDQAIVQKKLKKVLQFDSLGFVGRADNVGVAVITGLPTHADYDGMIHAMSELGNVSGFIIDLRRNVGGSESRAAQIAGLFAVKRTMYARTQTRNNRGKIEETQPRYLEPAASDPIGVPVVCLIGPGCISSGEGFALMMKSLDHVTLIGQPTRGASGNPKPVTLSTHVRVRFSRWLSLETDGTPIESRGVLPDQLIEHVEGRDATFDRALELLR